VAQSTESQATDERLVDAYNRYFQAIPVNSQDRLADVFRLRYHVYCIERQFEKAEEFPDQQEHDHYDSRSLQTLLVHRSSRTIAGTVRLILPDPANPIGSLPIDLVCKEPLLRDTSRIPRESCAEVSRFTVSRSFRRRVDEADSPHGVTDASLAALDEAVAQMSDRRIAPHLTVGLFAELIRVGHQHGITHWCAVTERALLRLLTRIGMYFTDLGPEVVHHGIRQPCYLEIRSMLERVKRERFDVWEILTDEGRVGPVE